ADLDLGLGRVPQAGAGGVEAPGDDVQVRAGGAHGRDLLPGDFQHHGRHHVAVGQVVGQRVGAPAVQGLGAGRAVDGAVWAPGGLALLVVHDAVAQGLGRGLLLVGLDGRVDVEAAGIGLVAVLGKDQLAHGLGDVLGADGGGLHAGTDVQFLLLGGLGFLGR